MGIFVAGLLIGLIIGTFCCMKAALDIGTAFHRGDADKRYVLSRIGLAGCGLVTMLLIWWLSAEITLAYMR